MSKRSKTCGASTKGSGSKCRLPAGWGTKHPGSGRCRLHGGASTGPRTKAGKAKTAKNATRHGLSAERFRLRALEHRRQVEELLAEAEKDTSPRSIEGAASALAQDARRLLSRLQCLEERADQLEAEARLDDQAEAELHRRLVDWERALNRTRQAQIQLTTRHPDLEADQEGPILMDLEGGMVGSVFIVRPRTQEDKDNAKT